jgi:hypothetical protein
MPTTQIQANAGRDPFAAHRVTVYTNLHMAAWSIRALDGPRKGRVVAHAQALALTICDMHVNEGAQ